MQKQTLEKNTIHCNYQHVYAVHICVHLSICVYAYIHIYIYIQIIICIYNILYIRSVHLSIYMYKAYQLCLFQLYNFQDVVPGSFPFTLSSLVSTSKHKTTIKHRDANIFGQQNHFSGAMLIFHGCCWMVFGILTHMCLFFYLPKPV